MTDKAQTIQVSVLDEPFRIRSEANPAYTREVAAHVDRTLRQIRDSMPGLEGFQAAVLGAMEITDDLFRGRVERRRGAEAAVERLRELERAIDARLDEVPDFGPPAEERRTRGRKKAR